MKKIEMTGSPKSAGFDTKENFLTELTTYGFEHGKMTKKNNQVNILVTNNLDSDTSKMKMAKELGVEIMTYEQLRDSFDLQPNI